MDSLLSLPAGAVFTDHSGQAKATVATFGDTLLIRADCDSLSQLVYQLEEQIGSLKSASNTKETVSSPAEVPIRTKLKYLLAGLVAGFIICLFIKIKRK